MKELRDQNHILFENYQKLSTEIQQLKAKIDKLDQKSLENVIEIVGVPIIRNEYCKSVVKEITDKLKIECDIFKTYSITTKNKTDMKIIAWLPHNNVRNRLVAEMKKKDWPLISIETTGHHQKYILIII